MIYHHEVSTQDLPGLPIGLDEELQRVITVRVPASLHAALRQQAMLCQTSMNCLCISRIIAEIPGCLIVPSLGHMKSGKQKQKKQDVINAIALRAL